MKDQEINIAIAEARGYTHCKTGTDCVIAPDGTHETIPDYCHDLNAMWLVEDDGLHPAEIDEYAEQLYMIVERFWTCDRWVRFSRYSINHALSHATAIQRAEAFLKTKGLWME